MRTLPAITDLSSVRKLRLGADVVTIADVDAWRARFPATTTLERSYSSTETAMAFHVSIDHATPVPGPLVPMGRPIAGVDEWIVDDEGNKIEGEGTGELVVRSANVVSGYLNAPELNKQNFTFDARTGTATFSRPFATIEPAEDPDPDRGPSPPAT